jgi:hypothetical protein
MAPKRAVLILIISAFILAAGCTSPVIPTGGGGTTGGSQAQGSGGAFSPGPVVTVPPDYYVEFQVNKNMISTNPTIDVYFSGGKGQIFLQRALVEVQKSDGTVESKEFVRPEGGQISKGDKVTFRGTTGTDRVVITVTIVNKNYKIFDQLYDFKTHP